MSTSLASLAWSLDSLDLAFARIAGSVGVKGPTAPKAGESIEAMAAARGCEAVPVTAGFGEAREVIAGLSPGMVAIPEGILVVLRASRRRLRVLAPSGRVVGVPTQAVLELQCQVEPGLEASVDGLLASLEVGGGRRRRLREALLARHLRDRALEGLWVLRPPATAPLRALLREQHVWRRLAIFLVASALHFIALATSWRFIGAASLASWGTEDALVPWILSIVTMNVAGVVSMWMAGSLAVDLGAVLKRRLLAGALGLEADSIRTDGAGHFLAMAIEGEAVETAALAGGFGVLLGGLDLAVAAVVLGLAMGTGAAVFVVLWAGLLAVLIAVYYARRRQWTRLRRDRSNDLVEHMVGQRTLVTQLDLERWGADEDRETRRYLEASTRVDGVEAILQALATRGWPLLGGGLLLLALTQGLGVEALAAVVGGVLLAAGGFQLLVYGLSALAGAVISIELLWPLLDAASGARGLPTRAASAPAEDGGRVPVLEAKGLRFAYDGGASVLDGCDLEVMPGDRILIEGASGSGKSTLGAVLAALRMPQGGELRLAGQRPESVGERQWRRRVVAVPQFHDNHVFSSTYAFNVLMGHDWPPGSADVGVTTMISEELGLTPLLLRMPAGVQQQVGETGWQLSHGEKSRIFIARALAQDAEVLILDESLGAIDPVTVRRIVAALDRRDVAVVLITHH